MPTIYHCIAVFLSLFFLFLIDILSFQAFFFAIILSVILHYVLSYLYHWFLSRDAYSHRTLPVSHTKTSPLKTTSFSALTPLIDSIPIPIILLGKNDIILYSNTQADALFHFMWNDNIYNSTTPGHKTQTSHKINGKKIYHFIRNPEIIETICQARLSKSIQQKYFYEMHPTERHFNFTIVPLTSHEKSEKHLSILYFSELTKEKIIQRSRSEFVANASHELKTPLTIIKGNLETINGGKPLKKADHDHFIHVSLAEAKRMENLIQDLLTLSQVELAEHITPNQKIDVIDLLNTSIQSFSHHASQYNCKIDVQVEQKSIIIMGIADEIQQVFINLLDNAFKYGRNTKNKDNLISVSAKKIPHNTVSITFTDFGMGIDAQDIPKLTERFFRTHDAKKIHNSTGTGLGLAIVKHILNKHHGEMTIKSQRGQGTSVQISFPTPIV